MDIPPKIVKHQLASRAPAAAQASDTESLPVLEAFQSFLEVERKKTRKRIIAVSVFFLLLIGVAVGGAVVAGLLLAGQMKKGMKGMQDQVSAVRGESEKRQQDVQKALSTFAAEAEKLRDEVTKGRASESTELEARIGAYNEELAKLKTALDDLQKENSQLNGDLATLKTGFPAFSNDIRRAMQDLLQSRPSQSSAAAPVASAVKPAKRPASVYPDLIVAITPADTGNAVPWCIPIPE